MTSVSPDFDRHEPGFDVLHRVSEDVYTYTTQFLFQGAVPIGNRSVIVRIPPQGAGAEGTLVVINPAELRPEVEQALKRLEQETRSTVRYLISPGDWHYLFIGQHVKAFPQAKAYVAPGRVPSMSPDFPYTLIDPEAHNPFPELLPHLVCLSFGGLLDFSDPARKLPRYERVFFHPASRAITSGDVLYYIGKDELHPAMKAIGQRARVLDFHFLGWKMVRSAVAVQRSLEQMMAWDFDRFISIHGEPGNMLERGAKAQVADILAWSKAPPADFVPVE